MHQILEEKLRKATGVSIPSWRTSPSSGQTPKATLNKSTVSSAIAF